MFSSGSKCTTTTLCIAFLYFTSLTSESAEALFRPGKEYVFEYEATSSSGVLVPSKAQSSWGFSGKLVIQVDGDTAWMQVSFLIVF